MSTHQICPHCQSAVHAEATVCRGCGAEKGYFRNNGIVFGYTAVQALRAIALLIAIACGIAWLSDSSEMGKSLFGFGAVVSLVFAGLFSINLFAGPSWYR